MNTRVTSFQFNTSAIRVVTLEGNPWFVAAECRDLLELSQHGKLYSFLDDSEKKVVMRNEGGQISSVLFAKTQASRQLLISESGLYKLIMRSDKPQAKGFQDWVTKEVLPSIRKTGSFVTGQPSLVENPTMSALTLAEAQMNTMQAIFGALKEQAEVQAQQTATINAQAIELAEVKEQVADVLSYVSVFDFLKTFKLHKAPMAVRIALGKKSSEITRTNGWMIKTKEFSGQSIYPSKAIHQAAQHLKIIH